MSGETMVVDDADRLLSQMSTAVVSVDAERRICRFNESAEHTFAVSRADAIGRDFFLLPIAWSDGSTPARLWEARLAAGSVRFDDLALLRPGGGTSLVGATVTGLDPEPRGMLVVARDITQLRQQQLEQMRSLRHEAISRLSSGIAHEFNTPLQILTGSLAASSRDVVELIDLLGTGTLDPAALDEVRELRVEIPKALANAREAVERIAALVEGMRLYSGSRATDRVPIDVNDCLRRVLALEEPQWSRFAVLDLQLDESLRAAPGDPRGLFEALFQVVDNAWKAIADRNASRIGLGRLAVSSKGELQRVVIEVSDDGIGMNESTRQRAFDPFFTTREVGVGSGQGLAIARSIIQGHGGTIELESELGRGTRCRIELPSAVG